MAEARVTQAGVYVSVDPGESARVTQAGAYVSIAPPGYVRMTQAGVYVSIAPPVGDPIHGIVDTTPGTISNDPTKIAAWNSGFDNHNVIEGCRSWLNGQGGIVISGLTNSRIAENVAQDNGQETPNTHDNIHITGNAADNYITGNMTRQTATVGDTRYGIYFAAGTTGNLIRGNDARNGGVSGEIQDDGSNVNEEDVIIY